MKQHVKIGDVTRLEPEVGGDLPKGRPRTNPELADFGVRVELVRSASGAFAEVQCYLVGVAYGFKHEHGSGLGIAAPSRKPRKSGVGPKRIGHIVRALFEAAGRHQQTDAWVQLGDAPASYCGKCGLFPGQRQNFEMAGPVFANVLLKVFGIGCG